MNSGGKGLVGFRREKVDSEERESENLEYCLFFSWDLKSHVINFWGLHDTISCVYEIVFTILGYIDYNIYTIIIKKSRLKITELKQVSYGNIIIIIYLFV